MKETIGRLPGLFEKLRMDHVELDRRARLLLDITERKGTKLELKS
jgi:hypothetical protein